MISETMIKKYCSEKFKNIENYWEALNDETQIWECHHRLETHFKNGKRRERQLSSQELKDRDLYFRRPPEELILLAKSEHRRLHHEGYSKSEETCKKMSSAQKGVNTWAKGRHYYNNGVVEVMRLECPEGFVPGRLKK